MVEIVEAIQSIPKDYINGSFELVGALVCSTNITRIRRDKVVEGFNPSTQAFFASWGLWNLLYYPSLDQWASFWGGVALVGVNVTWLLHVWYYKQQRKHNNEV